MSNEQKMALYDKVDEAIGGLNKAQRAFLRATGWEYHCDHPDCCWRWSKEINGRNYSLSVDDAIQMELRL